MVMMHNFTSTQKSAYWIWWTIMFWYNGRSTKSRLNVKFLWLFFRMQIASILLVEVLREYLREVWFALFCLGQSQNSKFNKDSNAYIPDALPDSPLCHFFERNIASKFTYFFIYRHTFIFLRICILQEKSFIDLSVQFSTINKVENLIYIKHS